MRWQAPELRPARDFVAIQLLNTVLSYMGRDPEKSFMRLLKLVRLLAVPVQRGQETGHPLDRVFRRRARLWLSPAPARLTRGQTAFWREPLRNTWTVAPGRGVARPTVSGHSGRASLR